MEKCKLKQYCACLAITSSRVQSLVPQNKQANKNKTDFISLQKEKSGNQTLINQKEEGWREKREEIYYAQIPIPHDQSNQYVWQHVLIKKYTKKTDEYFSHHLLYS